MAVYKFKNKLNNSQKWPRFFVAFSLIRAQELAEEFQNTINEANGDVGWLRLTFDFDDVTIVDTEKDYQREGYIELNDREI